eukprot:TCONS_00049292-protein
MTTPTTTTTPPTTTTTPRTTTTTPRTTTTTPRTTTTTPRTTTTTPRTTTTTPRTTTTTPRTTTTTPRTTTTTPRTTTTTPRTTTTTPRTTTTTPRTTTTTPPTTTTTPLATTTTPPTTTTTPPTTTTTTTPHTTKTTTSTLSKTSENQGNSSTQSLGSITVENPEQNLICKHNQMIFKFKPTFKHNVTIRKMSLRDQACRFRYDKTSGEYQTATAYTMCGTTMVEERRHILFKNLVRVTYVNNEIEANPLIERIEYYYIGLECRIRKNYLKTLKGQQNDSHIPGDGGIVVGPQTLHIDEYKEANASFRIDFQVYKSLAYDDSYGTEEFPIYLQVSHRIYFELSLDKKNLSVIPHNCYATKTPSYLADPKYYFIEKRCEKDETYRRHHHQQKQQINQNKFRFSIEAFNFKDSDSIFVHCESYVCQDTSKENCQFGCPASNGRSKRDGIALGEIDEEIFMTSTLEIKIAEPTFHNYPTNNQTTTPTIESKSQPGHKHHTTITTTPLKALATKIPHCYIFKFPLCYSSSYWHLCCLNTFSEDVPGMRKHLTKCR